MKPSAPSSLQPLRAAAGLAPEAPEHLVDGVLGHLPVRRQLAAGDGDHAGGTGRHAVAARQVGGPAARRRLDERTQAGPHARDVVGRDVGRDRVVERARGRRRCRRRCTAGRRAGRRSRCRSCRRRCARTCRHRVAPHGTTNRLRLSLRTGITTAMSLRTFDHGTVRWTPLAGTDRVGVDAVLERPHLVGPHAGGVDDDRGPHVDAPVAGVDGRPVDAARARPW